MKYRISFRANADIESVCDYIAKDNPEAAERLDARIHEVIRLLARFPGMGHIRADVPDERYRFHSVGNYAIAYRIEGKMVVIVRVVHGARDFRQIFRRKR
jgi:plasmid stabilization system protein ParE